MTKRIENVQDSDVAETISVESNSPQTPHHDHDGQEDATPEAVTKPFTRRRHFILLGLSIVLLAGAATYSWFWYSNHHKAKATDTVSSVRKTASTASKSGSPQYTFYQAPKQLGNLNFFSDLSIFGTNCPGTQTTGCPLNVTANDISYYQIGTTPTNQPVIIAFYRFTSQPGALEYTALGQPDGKYAILSKVESFDLANSNAFTQQVSQLQGALSSNVTVDTTTTIPALTFPSQVTVDGEVVALQGIIGDNTTEPPGYFIDGLSGIRGWYYNSNVASADMKKIGREGGVTYYEVIAQNSDPNYEVKEIYGVVGGVYAARYVAQDPLSSSKAPSITWSTGSTASTPTYTSAAQGCGSSTGFVVAKNISPSQLTVAGQGPDQTTVYKLPITSTLFNDYYTDYSGGSGLSDGSLENLTATQFQDVHAVVVAKNALGDYVAYQRSDMSTGGQCGKPVIYLYPQKATNVDVSVGAHITASDPLYTANGWQDVLAQPNGQLTYQGKSYDSLYWDGTGVGSYPLIDTGTIVPRSKIVSTIKLQLQEQGLDAHEATDFLTYWQSKLPTTPYTRLTWLDTTQLNELAPLQITPVPTTVIRVFLDFQGLQQPFKITPQTFHAVPRKGFTVVEWGGLLRNS